MGVSFSPSVEFCDTCTPDPPAGRVVRVHPAANITAVHRKVTMILMEACQEYSIKNGWFLCRHVTENVL